MAGLVIIVDGIAANRTLLKSRLEQAFYQVQAVASGGECLAAMRATRPDAVVLDADVPDATAEQVIAALRAMPDRAEVPVLTLADRLTPARRLALLSAGAEDVWPKPVAPTVLMARLRALTRARAALEQATPADLAEMRLGLAEPSAGFEHPASVAILSLRREAGVILRQALGRAMGGQVALATREDVIADLTQAQALGRAARYDAILLHYDRASEPLARQIVTELHSRGGVPQVPLCLVGPGGQAAAAAYFDLGADEVVEDSAEPAELALRLARLVRRKRRLDGLRATVAQGLRLSVIDPLTGLRNRRYAMQRLTQIAETALRERLDFAVMLIDMDRFKEVNDRQGHAAGDAVLVAVAARMAATMAEGDLLARIGGEEFLVCLPGADPDSARRRSQA